MDGTTFFGKQIYMEFPNRLAVLLDGEWIRKTLYEGGNPSPSPHDLANVVHEITERSSDLSDYKIYFNNYRRYGHDSGI